MKTKCVSFSFCGQKPKDWKKRKYTHTLSLAYRIYSQTHLNTHFRLEQHPKTLCVKLIGRYVLCIFFLFFIPRALQASVIPCGWDGSFTTTIHLFSPKRYPYAVSYTIHYNELTKKKRIFVESLLLIWLITKEWKHVHGNV